MLNKLMALLKGSSHTATVTPQKTDLTIDQVFQIDFLYSSDLMETLKNIQVRIPAIGNDIFLGEDYTFFKSFRIEDLGWSDDRRYRKVGTSDFIFWVRPTDFDRFMAVAKHRRTEALEKKRQQAEAVMRDYGTPVMYDPIDHEIYWCCIEGKPDAEAKSVWGNFASVEEKITEICVHNGGRYYKSQAKGAKWVIVYGFGSRGTTNVQKIREKGYKVATFEDAMTYFGLDKMWKIDKMTKAAQDYRESMIREYGQP